MAKILIVDDQPDYFELLTATELPHTFNWCSSIKEMSNIIKNDNIELILMDWDLIEDQGVTHIPELKANYITSKIPIIMLTGRNLTKDLVLALSNGADDYISKPAELSLIMAKIDANLRKYHISNLTNQLFIKDIHLNENLHEVTINNKSIQLSQKEFKIIKALCLEPDKVFTREELNVFCSGKEIHVSNRTIDTFIRQLRIKLKKIDLIETVPTKGYKFNYNFNKSIQNRKMKNENSK